MADLEIRAPRPDELPAVADLTVDAYRAEGVLAVDTGYEAKLRDVAHRADHAELLVALDGGAVLGSVTVVHHGTPYAEVCREGELEFRMLAVAPSARGRGIGEALTRAVLDRARALGLRKVVLSSLRTMHTAHRLYDRLGFQRLPARDWRPFPHVDLIAYGYDL